MKQDTFYIFLHTSNGKQVVYNWGLLAHVEPKNHARKINEIHKDFELYQVFNFLSENVLIPQRPSSTSPPPPPPTPHPQLYKNDAYQNFANF